MFYLVDEFTRCGSLFYRNTQKSVLIWRIGFIIDDVQEVRFTLLFEHILINGCDVELVFFICLFIGVLTAFIGSIAGLGGGIVLIPSLFLAASLFEEFAWVTPQTIVGISLITMVFTALSSTYFYHKVKHIDYRTGLLFLIGSIPASVLGSWLNQFVNTNAFFVYFGILMIIISLLLFIKRDAIKPVGKKSKKNTRIMVVNGQAMEYHVSPWLAILLSISIGVLSGLFGIGGGSIAVPIMILLFGIPVHIATATSMFMILFISIAGAGTHIVLGNIIWEYALFFVPGALIGGFLGAKVNQMLNGDILRWVLRIILILIGLRMIYQGIF